MAWLLPSKEAAEIQHEFLAIDTDKQGTISMSEWKALMVHKLAIADMDAAEIFNAVDANHDDEIHYSEFLAAMLSTRCDLHNHLLDVTFRNFDKDLSGYITADNLRDTFGTTFEGMPLERLVEEADLLEDGRISFAEFKAFVCGTPVDSNTVCLGYPAVAANDRHAEGIRDQQCCALM